MQDQSKETKDTENGETTDHRPRRSGNAYNKNYAEMNRGNTTDSKGAKKKTNEEGLDAKEEGKTDTQKETTDQSEKISNLEKQATQLEEKIEEVEVRLDETIEEVKGALYELPIEDHTINLHDTTSERIQELNEAYTINEQETKKRREKMAEVEKLLETRDRLTKERIAIGKLLAEKQRKDKEFEIVSAKYYLEEEERKLQEEELEIKTRGEKLINRQKIIRQRLQSWNDKQDRHKEDKETTEESAGKWEEAKVRGAASEADITKSRSHKKSTNTRKNSTNKNKGDSNTNMTTQSQQRIAELEAKIKRAQTAQLGENKEISESQRRINELEQKLKEIEGKMEQETKEPIVLSASQQRINELERKLEEREQELKKIQDLKQGIPRLKMMGLVANKVPDTGILEGGAKRNPPNQVERKKLGEMKTLMDAEEAEEDNGNLTGKNALQLVTCSECEKAGRKEDTKSGKWAKSHGKIKKPELWPHMSVMRKYVKRTTFDQLDFKTFVAGETKTILTMEDKMQANGRLTLLCKSAHWYCRSQDWSTIKGLYEAVMDSIEIGEETRRKKKWMYTGARHTIKVHVVRAHPTWPK